MPRPAKCSSCYWSGYCYQDGGCEDYTTLDLHYYDDDGFVDRLIESERADFIRYWRKIHRESEQELFI